MLTSTNTEGVPVAGSMTVKEAQELTARVRASTEEFAALLHEAWAGKVWEPLGYSGFREWLAEAVGISRSRAYQLLAVVELENAVREVLTPLPDDMFVVTDTQARLIGSHGLPEFLKTLAEQATSNPAANLIAYERAVRDLREQAEKRVAAPTPAPAESVVDIASREVGGGRRDQFTVRMQMRSFQNMADTIPAPSKIDDREILEEVTSTLRDTTHFLLQRLEEYEAALGGRVPTPDAAAS
ncbi:MAG: hypothetical protein CMH82_05495 [Nocardioides sp.]|nr:hypothetical protein [Nocardioides sp.]